MKQDNSNEILNDVTTNDYKYGFVTDIETDIIPTGLNEDIIRHISEKKKEPEWLLEFRLKAYAYWKTLEMPHWAHLNIPVIMLLPRPKRLRKASMKWTLSYARHSTSWEFRSKNR